MGRAVARAPISGFVLLSVCLPACLSLLASGEVSRVAIGLKQSRAHLVPPVDSLTTLDGRRPLIEDDLKNEDDLNNEDNLKNENDLKYEEDLE